MFLQSQQNKWMSNNFLKLNKDKLEIILVCPQNFNWEMGKLAYRIKSEATSLVLDLDLTIESHINKVAKIFQFRNIA